VTDEILIDEDAQHYSSDAFGGGDSLSPHDRPEKRITGDEPSPPLVLVLLESSVSARFVRMECITVNE